MINLINSLWLAAIALNLALALRLAQLRLVVRYPLLFSWVVAGSILQLILEQFRADPSRYAQFYPTLLISLALLECATTWEAFSLRCERYGGARFIGRRLLAGLVGVGVLACLFLLRAQFIVNQWPEYGAPITTTKHVVDSLLAMFLLSSELAFSLIWKPPTPTNVLLYGRTFTAFLVANAAVYFAQNVTGSRFVGTLDVLLQLNSAIFALILLLGLRRADESTEFPRGPDSGEIQRQTNRVLDFLKELTGAQRPR